MRRKNNLLGMHGRSTDEDERSALLRIQHSKSVIAVVLAVVIALSVVAGAGVAMAGGTDGHGNGTDNGDGDGDGAGDGNGDDGDMAGAIEIDECTVIDEPGSYVLTEDIEDSDADVCIDIQSSDVHFDGNGHTIDGDLARSEIEEASQGPAPRTRVGVGVNVRTEERVENVTVEDVTTTNWFHGVLSENVSGGMTSEITAHDNGGGIIYDNSSDVSVTDSNSSNNVILGVIVDSRAGVSNANNEVLDNTAENNGAFGTAIFLSNNSTIEGNDVNDNGFVGVFGYGTTNTTIADNSGQNNSIAGLALFGDLETEAAEEPVEEAEPRAPQVNVSRDNVITGNDFSENGYIGIGLLNSSGAYLADNDVSDTQGIAPFPFPFPSTGILLDAASNTAVVSNDATGNNGTGVALVNSSDNNLFVDNDASDNAEDGFNINGSENVALIVNTANDNADDGVEVTGSNGVVLLLNELEGNGDQAVEVNDSENVIRLNSVEDFEELLSEVLDS